MNYLNVTSNPTKPQRIRMKTLIPFSLLVLSISCNQGNETQSVELSESAENGYLQKSFDVPVKRYCLTMELENDPELIREYIDWHDKVWPEVLEGIKQVGILDHEIYRHNNKVFMILVTPADFDFEKQMTKLSTLPRQAEWEAFMSKYQVTTPEASSADKWVRMERIFKLE